MSGIQCWIIGQEAVSTWLSSEDTRHRTGGLSEVLSLHDTGVRGTGCGVVGLIWTWWTHCVHWGGVGTLVESHWSREWVSMDVNWSGRRRLWGWVLWHYDGGNGVVCCWWASILCSHHETRGNGGFEVWLESGCWGWLWGNQLVVTDFSYCHLCKSLHFGSMHLHKAVGLSQVGFSAIGRVTSERESLDTTWERVLWYDKTLFMTHPHMYIYIVINPRCTCTARLLYLVCVYVSVRSGTTGIKQAYEGY